MSFASATQVQLMYGPMLVKSHLLAAGPFCFSFFCPTEYPRSSQTSWMTLTTETTNQPLLQLLHRWSLDMERQYLSMLGLHLIDIIKRGPGSPASSRSMSPQSNQSSPLSLFSSTTWGTMHISWVMMQVLINDYRCYNFWVTGLATQDSPRTILRKFSSLMSWLFDNQETQWRAQYASIST